jgi:RHS repeat-associated protein
VELVVVGCRVQYFYNALNQRVRSVIGSAAYEFVFDPNARRVSIWDGNDGHLILGQAYWNGLPVEFYGDGYAHFEHLDWLGTKRATTDYTGAVEATFTSMPFGDFYSILTGNEYDAEHFGLMDHDYETTTDHAQFRQYSEAQGRWISPDPYDGSYDFSSPQSFNRYSYVLNNPLNFVDPLGLDCDPREGPCPTPPPTPPSSCDAFCQWEIGILFGQKAGAVTVGRPVNGGNTNVAPKTISVKSGGAPSKTTSQPATPQSPLAKYVAFLGCYYNSTIEQITDEEDGQSPIYFGVIDSLALVALKGGLGPWGIVPVAGAALSHIGVGVKANIECTESVYGH